MKRKTKAIHGRGHDEYSFNRGLASPVSPSSTFTFGSIAEAEAAFEGRSSAYVYSRGRNPNLEEFEEKMALLEEGSYSVSFASGMGAIATLLLALLGKGKSLAAHPVLYGSSHNLIAGILPDYGIRTTLLDLRDEENLIRLKKDGVDVVYLETPCNPTLEILDIARIRECLGPEVKIVVDNTFATPMLQQPLALGADFVVHSCTKYIGGHGDALGGIVIGRDKGFEAELRFGFMCEFGAVMSPFNAWLFNRGLKTLDYRMKGHCSNAMAIARFLEGRKGVRRVYYPGLPSFPGHELAVRQMEDFGGMLAFEVEGSEEQSIQVVERLELFKLAVSLGDVESLVEHPMRMTHRSYSEEERLALGIDKSLIRLSVGLEDPEDLIDDLDRALEVIA